ncbi:MAG: MBL fold metallo-hydrolase, partial [Acidimicrobiia bacterium]|nr:MBL fold metallo-hydrolase [Acidimicrobiia bacterium]
MSFYEDDRVVVHRLVTEPIENNVWIVACRATGEAVIIDAAGEADRIIYAVKPYQPRAILTTHGHFDHVGAAPAVKAALSIPLLIHPDDEQLARLSADRPLVDDEVIRLGELTLSTVHTPGHTPGSTCFVLTTDTGDELLFSGDTLFPGGPG